MHVGMGIVRNLTLLISIVLDDNNISAVQLPLQKKKEVHAADAQS